MKLRYFFLCGVLALASVGALAQVVVVGTRSATGELTRDQVAAAFMGKMVGIEPVDQKEGNAIREEFYTKDVGKSASQVRSYWAKISFTGKGTPPKEYANSAEVKKALAENPSAIGYIEKAAVDASVRVVFEGH